jgi:hypothetical protein
MKQALRAFLIGSSLLLHSVCFAQGSPESSTSSTSNYAVNITIGSKRGSVDETAVRSVRDAIGSAISAGTVDIFYVYYPRAGGATSTEFGLSACAEAGFNSAPEKFKNLISQLRSIRHQTQTFINIERVEQCKDIEPIEPTDCGGILGILCPRFQYCETGAGQCKTADAQGSCKVIPEACNAEYKPVCGCDGKTYANACEAARARVSLDHYGKCKPPEELVCDESRPENCRNSR